MGALPFHNFRVWVVGFCGSCKLFERSLVKCLDQHPYPYPWLQMIIKNNQVFFLVFGDVGDLAARGRQVWLNPLLKKFVVPEFHTIDCNFSVFLPHDVKLITVLEACWCTENIHGFYGQWCKCGSKELHIATLSFCIKLQGVMLVFCGIPEF